MALMRRMKYGIGLLLLAAAGAGIVLYWYTRETPEAKIRQVIAELVNASSKHPGSGGAASLLKAKAGAELFTDPCRIEIAGTMFHGELHFAELQSHLARYRSSFAEVVTGTEAETVTVTGPDAGTAEFTGTLTGYLKAGGRVAEVRELVCDFQKGEDGKWRIARMQVRNVLEK